MPGVMTIFRNPHVVHEANRSGKVDPWGEEGWKGGRAVLQIKTRGVGWGLPLGLSLQPGPSPGLFFWGVCVSTNQFCLCSAKKKNPLSSSLLQGAKNEQIQNRENMAERSLPSRADGCEAETEKAALGF